MLGGANENAKDLHPTMPTPLPIYNVMSPGLWLATVQAKNVEFNGFKTGESLCGARLTAF